MFFLSKIFFVINIRPFISIIWHRMFWFSGKSDMYKSVLLFHTRILLYFKLSIKTSKNPFLLMVYSLNTNVSTVEVARTIIVPFREPLADNRPYSDSVAKSEPLMMLQTTVCGASAGNTEACNCKLFCSGFNSLILFSVVINKDVGLT